MIEPISYLLQQLKMDLTVSETLEGSFWIVSTANLAIKVHLLHEILLSENTHWKALGEIYYNNSPKLISTHFGQ